MKKTNEATLTTRFNQNDLLAKDKIESSSYLIYNKKYRKLSNDARMMYQYIIKRFSITEMHFIKAMEEDTMENFTFIDEDNNLFCFVSNDELRFVLNLSEGTVVKVKKELHSVGLLEEVKQTANKTNRLYINKVEVNKDDYISFKTELNEFRTLLQNKRKAKNDNRDTRKTEANKIDKRRKKTIVEPTLPIEPQILQFTELQNLEFMNNKICGQSTKEDMSTEEDLSTKESLSLISLKSFKSLKKEEEEEYIYKLRMENVFYDFIYEFLKDKNVKKNTVHLTLVQCSEHGIESCRMKEVEEQYKQMMERINAGNRILDFPFYFANGLLQKTEIATLGLNYKNEVEKERKEWEASRPNKVPFYNWLEERD